MTTSETAAALTTLAVAGLMLVLLLMNVPVLADAVCLSKSEARELWPTRHIYWYLLGKRHCWSNRRGPPRNLRIDPVMGNLRAQADSNSTKKADRLKYVEPDEYTELDAQADKDAFFQAEPLPLWPPVLPLQQQHFVPWDERVTGAFR